jgi:hypothetical protein
MWDADASAVNFGEPEPVPGLTCWTGQESGIAGAQALQDASRIGIQLDDEFTVAVPLSDNEETHLPPCFMKLQPIHRILSRWAEKKYKSNAHPFPHGERPRHRPQHTTF